MATKSIESKKRGSRAASSHSKNDKPSIKAPPPGDENSETIGFEALGLDDQNSYLQFVEAMGSAGIDPFSDDALRLQARYVAQCPTHPLDVLRRIMQNPFCDPKDRIAASKALLEYSARKVPSSLEVTGKNGAPLTIDSTQLMKLSAKELDVLEQLLMKAQIVPSESVKR
jgi:hypothetical protein